MKMATHRAMDPAPRNVVLLADRSARQIAAIQSLGPAGVTVSTTGSAAECLRVLSARPAALCIVDLASDRAPIAAVCAIRAQHPHIPLAAIFDPDHPLVAADAIHAGAAEILPWPFTTRDIATVLANACDLLPLDVPAAARPPADHLIAQSPAMRRVAELVTEAARSRVSVAITGEPGTGRTLAARTIHGLADDRGTRPLVIEDCTGDTPQDLERRLFGVMSAPARSVPAAAEQIGDTGAIARAIGGTLLLRNLADAPARLQIRLARLLRDGEAVLLNGTRTSVELDVQVIAMFDPGVDAAISEGGLRGDLIRALAQIRIDMPPLRRRREDIPLLALHTLHALCRERNVPAKSLSRAAVQVVTALPWPGNASELRRLLEALVDSVPGPVIQLEDVLEQATLDGLAAPADVGATLRDARARFERDCISAVLMRHRGRVPEAAKALGIQRTNLYRKIRQLNVARSLLSARR